MSWQLFDRIAAFARAANMYRSENLFQDQSSLARVQAAGEFINFSTQSHLLEQTNLQINRLERYKDFDQMDEVGEIHAALNMYGSEASLVDSERKHALMIKAKTLRVKEELENLFYNILMVDQSLRPMIRHLCKYGDFAAEIIPTQNRTGVASVRHMNIYNFTRVETKFGDLVGFFHQDELAAQPTFFHPWQVMHLRLTSYENIYQPYGRGLLDGARKHFKQLRLMEDAAIIYRLTRAPEKRVFTIPVGNIPTKDVPQFIQLIARDFKKKKFFDPSSGDVNERWHPLIQEDDYWLPQRADGVGPTVDTLPGAENLDQIADIEYFKKKMVAALSIPFSRVGIGEPSDSDQEPLSKVAPEFAKALQHIQQEVVMGMKKVAICHLAMCGFAAEDIRGFELHMTASSAIDELYRTETWNARADLIGALLDTGIFPVEFLLQRFTDMTLDEIDQMREAAAEQAARDAAKELMTSFGPAAGGGGTPGGMGGGGAADTGEAGGAELPLEGYNHALEQQVLNEYKEYLKGPKTRPIVETKIYNGFDKILNDGELDNLPYPIIEGQPPETQVKRVISEDLCKEAIKRAEDLIILGSNVSPVIEEDVTDADLPS
jgi:hypothetical protein